MKKKAILLITILLAGIVGIFRWAPKMSEDGGEQAVRILNARENKFKDTASLGRPSRFRPENCDGVFTRWRPFGRLVTNCKRDWYVTF